MADEEVPDGMMEIAELDLSIYPPGAPGSIVEVVEFAGLSKQITILVTIHENVEGGGVVTVIAGNIPSENEVEAKTNTAAILATASQLVHDSIAHPGVTL